MSSNSNMPASDNSSGVDTVTTSTGRSVRPEKLDVHKRPPPRVPTSSLLTARLQRYSGKQGRPSLLPNEGSQADGDSGSETDELRARPRNTFIDWSEAERRRYRAEAVDAKQCAMVLATRTQSKNGTLLSGPCLSSKATGETLAVLSRPSDHGPGWLAPDTEAAEKCGTF